MDFEKLMKILPKDPIKWTTEDVSYWLDFIGLSSLTNNFKEAAIDGSCLKLISEEDLQKEMGITSNITRKKILNWTQTGIQEYSNYLAKAKMAQQPYSGYQADLDQRMIYQKKDSIDEEPYSVPNKNFLENTNLNPKPNKMVIESSDNIYDMGTSNIKIDSRSQPPEYMINSVPNSNISNPNSQNILHNPQQSSVLCQIPSNELVNGSQQNVSYPPQTSNIISEKNNQVLEKLDEEPIDEFTKQVNELIIQPSEGPQTSFYCIKESGGKIGRHSSNQILILEESISRYHAEIVFEKGEFYLKDIGSTTGTFIKVVDRMTLEEGMIIEMGSNQFYIEKIRIGPDFREICFYIIEGPNINQRQEIKFQERKGPQSIGRKTNNDLAFTDDHHLSNTHAKIDFINNKFVLEDMSSTNGSWRRLSKEGERSELFLLQDKTVFKIGTTSTYICKKNQLYINEKVSDSACIICCENDRDALQMPCKHNTACVKCSKNLRECPICRIEIKEFIKIYKA